jgi:hypothetical protein
VKKQMQNTKRAERVRAERERRSEAEFKRRYEAETTFMSKNGCNGVEFYIFSALLEKQLVMSTFESR